MDFAQILIRSKDESAAGWKDAQNTASEAIGHIQSLLPGLAIGLSAAGLVEFAKHALEAGEQLNKMSQRTGVSVEDLSKLKYAAQQSDVDIDKLALGIKKLSTNVFEAGDSNSEAAKTFKLLGVNAADVNGTIKPTNELLLDLADRFSKMEDGAGKSALAVRVFGKTGDELIPFLNQGREGIKQLTAEAEKLGLVMTKEGAEAAEKFNDSVKSIESASKSLSVSFINDLAPAISRIAEVMHNATVEHGAFFGLLTGAGAIAIEMMGFGWKDAAERAQALESELARLTAKQTEYRAELLKDPSDKILQGWIKGVDFQIKAKQEELRGLQQLVEAKKKQDEEDRAKNKKDAAPVLTGKGEKPQVDEVQAFIDKQNEAATQAIANYERTMALMGDTTEVAKVRYDTEFGKLAVIDDALKADMLLRAQGIDLEKAAIAAQEARQAAELKTEEQAAQFEIQAASRMAKIQEESDKADLEKAKRKQDDLIDVMDSLRTRSDIEEQEYVRRQQILQAQYQKDYANQSFWYGKLLTLDKQHANSSAQIEQQKNAAVQAMQIQTWQLGSELIASMPGQTKAAALAVIAITKGLAIAQVIMNTQVAVMRAFAEAGPFAGIPIAASLESLGAIQIGLIAATGLLQAGSVLSGGGGGGDAGGPVGTFQANPATGFPDSQAVPPVVGGSPTPLAPQEKRITVQLIGDGVVPMNWIRDSLIPALNDAVGDGVTLRASVVS